MKNLQEKSKSVTLPVFDSSVKWNIQIDFIDLVDESSGPCQSLQPYGRKKARPACAGPG
ncbi:hypothetical protein G5S34_05120 [Herbaspirillum frisingense]|uniref:hypothetical protein n=1 Tax=Herbaspirillum frisingense TaxID=92645 RepID=UPI00160259FF|nr:hypothetical protein [Herbaspirillum frisingense]QNB06212.1 hypothetical protein G5S34_05120 [Herbaspirillum frisingense]